MMKQSVLIMLLCTFNMHAAIILKGNSQASSDETFSFQIQQYQLSDDPDLVGTTLFVGARPGDGGLNAVNEFSVSMVKRDTTQFVGLTPKKVLLNDAQRTQEKMPNPLYDVGISFMALFNGTQAILAGAPERPVVVASNDLQTIYIINNFFSDGTVEVLSVQANGAATHNIPDAAAAVTAGIVGLEAAAPYVFAAVRPAAGVFGATDGGIALGMIGSIDVLVNGKKNVVTAPIIIDGPTGSVARTGGNRAVPFDVSSSFLKIGNNLAAIDSIIDMFWDPHVARLYVALKITGGAAGTDGGRAIAVGRISQGNILEFTDIAPISAFDNSTNKIVGVVGANAQVSIQKVRGMATTTALPYLIVQGNVGAPTATQRVIFALPLVSASSNQALIGTIADKNAVPENVYSPEGTIPSLTNRIITQPATTPSQMPLSTDAATQVGGGVLPDGDITDMFVYGDTVFVTVQTSDVNDQAGVFYSQAIFAPNGLIQSWTTWQRTTGTPAKVQSMVLDPITGQFTSLVANSANQVKTVQRTQWLQGNTTGLKPVTDAVANFFLPQQGGMQGLFDFVVTATTPATATPGLLDISALVATGLGKVMLVQTSRVVSGGIIPIGGDAFGAASRFINGEIDQTFPINSRIITIEGGVLDDLGPINAAEIARDGTSGANGYLFVGGSHGVAVLSKANGTGWSTGVGLSDQFLGLTSGMSFKKVGNYTNVYKLINDGQYLYVLTRTQLDRINLTQGNVGLGTISPVTIATNETVPNIGASGSFLDVIISGPLIVLATNNGLVRIGNGLDARTVDSASVSWEHVDAPETVGPMEQLWTVTTKSRAQTIAQTTAGGNLLALSAYRGKNQAQIARYTINDTSSTGVISSTVTRIDDLFVKDIPSYFANFGLFYNGIATDGSLYYGTHNQQIGDESALVTVLFSTKGVQTGSRFLSNKIIPVNVSNTALIAALIQSSATGSWLVGSDQGLAVNE